MPDWSPVRALRRLPGPPGRGAGREAAPSPRAASPAAAPAPAACTATTMPRAWAAGCPVADAQGLLGRARLRLLGRSDGVTPARAARPAMRWLGLLGLCAAYLQGGLNKLLDFPGAVAEAAHFGLPPRRRRWRRPPSRWSWSPQRHGPHRPRALARRAGADAPSPWRPPSSPTASGNCRRAGALHGGEAFFEHLGLAGGFLLVALARPGRAWRWSPRRDRKPAGRLRAAAPCHLRGALGGDRPRQHRQLHARRRQLLAGDRPLGAARPPWR